MGSKPAAALTEDEDIQGGLIANSDPVAIINQALHGDDRPQKAAPPAAAIANTPAAIANTSASGEARILSFKEKKDIERTRIQPVFKSAKIMGSIPRDKKISECQG